eukprot:Hpha_TRINITY_DN3452_c0_g1::TRINITY_DN3452_c0_g1_i1::g.32696::m.32696
MLRLVSCRVWRVAGRRMCGGGPLDGVGIAAEDAASAQEKLIETEKTNPGEQSPERSMLDEEHHVTFQRLLRRMLRSEVTTVVREAGGAEVAGFPESVGDREVVYAYAYSSPDEHQRHLEIFSANKELQAGLTPTVAMSGASLVLHLVTLAADQEVMHEAQGADAAEAPRKVGGFRINGFPVPLEHAHVDAALGAFRGELLWRRARGDVLPEGMGADLLGAAGTREKALENADVLPYFMPLVEGEDGVRKPVKVPITANPADGTAVPVFSNTLSAWLFVHRGLALQDPEQASKFKLSKLSAEQLWKACPTLALLGNSSLALNPIPHTEPKSGEPPTLLLNFTDMWWVNVNEDADPPASAA